MDVVVTEVLKPTAGTADEESSTAMVTIEHVFEIWIEPELARRGVTPADLLVRKALVVLKRDKTPDVLINAEFELIASVRATRDIAEGEDIYAADFDEVHSIKPVDIDEDAGWITFFAVPDGRLYLAFDFRYELGRSRGVLARAGEFIASAQDDLSADRPGPAIDNALAAAELAIMVRMQTHLAPENPKNRHRSRYKWFEDWARLGNVQSHQAVAIRRLEQLRGWARYADDGVSGPRDCEAARLVGSINELIEDTRLLIAARPVEL